MKKEILERLDLKSYFSSELQSMKTKSTKLARALCPFHDDTNPSLSVNFETGRFNCFGCDEKGSLFDFFMKKNGVDFPTALNALADIAGVSSKPEGKVSKIYDYTDESGNLLFQTVRYEPKDFRQRRPDGNGRWVYDLEGVGRVV